MCPKTLQLYFAIIVVIIIYYVVYRRISRCVSANFDTLGTLIQSSKRETSFSQSTITGFYKNRQVELRCPFFEKGRPRIFSIQPLSVPVQQKLFLLDYPRPTKNTQLKNNKVFYSPGGFFGRTDSYYKIYRKEELIQILEELTEAAHSVEAGSNYRPK